MKNLKRTRYYTMNSWNLSTAPAYNLKIHKVIDPDLQEKAYEMLYEVPEVRDEIDMLISVFNYENDQTYQAGFNGKSGGYLVLYRGGKRTEHYTKEDFKSGNGYGGRVYIADGIGWKNYEEAKEEGYIDRDFTTSIYTQPGKGIEEKEVPGDVLKRFRKLAVSIVKTVEYYAKNYEIGEEGYTVEKTRKVLKEV